MRRIHAGIAVLFFVSACAPRSTLARASRAWQPPGVEVPVFEHTRLAALVPDPFAAAVPSLSAPSTSRGAKRHPPKPPPRPKSRLAASEGPYESLGEIVVPMTGTEQVALRELTRHAEALHADAVRNVRVITYGTGKSLVGEAVRYPKGDAERPAGEAPVTHGPAVTPAPPEAEEP